MILLIIIGNTLVILTVLIVKKLHTKDNANNLLIVSLSISDLLVGVLVLPLALYIEVKEGHK
jgi:5-hydroxytryptamine receptor 7